MNEHIVRARSDLLFTEPFFGTLLLGLALIHDSKRIKTMATEKSIYKDYKETGFTETNRSTTTKEQEITNL